MLFEWDHGNWPKCGKHGVSKVEIEGLFESDPRVLEDSGHSLIETRLIALGKTTTGRSLFVIYYSTARRA